MIDTAISSLEKSALLELLAQKESQIQQQNVQIQKLQEQVNKLLRQIFGQSSEKHIPSKNPDTQQAEFGFAVETLPVPAFTTQTITYDRTVKTEKSNHKDVCLFRITLKEWMSLLSRRKM